MNQNLNVEDFSDKFCWLCDGKGNVDGMFCPECKPDERIKKIIDELQDLLEQNED